MAEAVVGPAVEVVKCAGPPLLRQIRYCFYYKENVENLRRRVTDLGNKRAELLARVHEAENDLKPIKKSVQDWFERVDKVTTLDEMILRLMDDEATFEMINQQCCQGLCCCRARWKIGRDAQKKIPIIEELLNQGQGFGDNVSDPPLPMGAVFIPTNEDFENFASRKYSQDQIIVALKDDKISLVGVYGMGGVGKTMLVDQVHKLVMEVKLFDVVAKTTVSQNVELIKIQNDIASKLGCLEQLQKTEDTKTRADMLKVRLTKENQKILVILDDVWTTDPDYLSAVGIPTCCKVIITARSIDVCNSLGSHKNIEVRVLSKEESWHLFKKNAGDVVDSHALQTVANEVVKECCGLPIALVTLGRALRNKDKLVWDDTCIQLRRSDFTYIEGMNSKVFSSIKLSYDHLGNEILKKCFLFCCLFPEDYQIETDKLLMYVMSDDMILQNLETLKEVRGRLQSVLDILIGSCLLLLDEKEEDGVISSVRMHDVVRDVAIRIASDEANGFFVKAGLGLKNWPERIGKCLRLSLMENQISVLPDQPELPSLLSLSLEGNRSLEKLPESFFQSMETLVALNIREIGIFSLPTSLSCLMNLRSLHLGFWDLQEQIDISVIGKLEKLEILNLSWCWFSSLPEEIGRLSNLKLLDLSNNEQLNFIPSNVIRKLSRLEELYMHNSFKGWKLEPTGDGTIVSLDEVAFLKCVQFDIKKDEIEASISIGYVFRNQSRLTAPSPVCHSIRVLLARVDDLKLIGCTGLKSVGQLVIGDGFKNMKNLTVQNCNEMEYLMSVVEDKIPTTSFIALEKLYLTKLPGLTTIWKGVIPIESLQYLKVMEVINCHGLRYLFSAPAMVLALQQLEKLKIWNCKGMVGIVAPLEEMVQKDQVLIPPQIFPNLREVVIEGCASLKDLYPLKNLSQGGLSQLRQLQVWNCKNLEEIFLINTDEEEDDLIDGKAILPLLESLSLRNLSSLVWNIPIGSLQNLRAFSIEGSSDSPILPMILVLESGLSQLEMLLIAGYKELKAIIDNHINPTADDDQLLVRHLQLNWSIQLLPRLKKMLLMDLPNLTTIAKGVIMSFGSYENLAWLRVERCNSLKHLLPIRLLVNGGLSKLQYIHVEECNEMEVIFNEDGGDDDHSKMVVAFLCLEEVRLISLPKLTKFHQGPPILDWPSLQMLRVKNCENLKRLPLNHHHIQIPKLKKIVGESERWFDEELEWEDQNLKSRLRPLFMKLEDDEEGSEIEDDEEGSEFEDKEESEIEDEEEY